MLGLIMSADIGVLLFGFFQVDAELRHESTGVPFLVLLIKLGS